MGEGGGGEGVSDQQRQMTGESTGRPTTPNDRGPFCQGITPVISRCWATRAYPGHFALLGFLAGPECLAGHILRLIVA